MTVATSHRVRDVKRTLALMLMMLATAASATATRPLRAEPGAHATDVYARAPAGEKTQWAPTGASSPLHARAVSRGESLEGASPYGREASKTSVAEREWTYANSNPTRFTDPDGRDAWGYPVARQTCEAKFGRGSAQCATPAPDLRTTAKVLAVPACIAQPELCVIGAGFSGWQQTAGMADDAMAGRPVRDTDYGAMATSGGMCAVAGPLLSKAPVVVQGTVVLGTGAQGLATAADDFENGDMCSGTLNVLASTVGVAGYFGPKISVPNWRPPSPPSPALAVQGGGVHVLAGDAVGTGGPSTGGPKPPLMVAMAAADPSKAIRRQQEKQQQRQLAAEKRQKQQVQPAKLPPAVRSRLRNAGLPGGATTHGPFRFLPEVDYQPGNPLPRGPGGGFLDRFGNEWVTGPYHGDPNKGFTYEWDVQLSEQGMNWAEGLLEWTPTDKGYINVAPDGTLSH
jgi:hypothetical protein